MINGLETRCLVVFTPRAWVAMLLGLNGRPRSFRKPLSGELGGYGAQAYPASECLRQFDEFRPRLEVALAPLDLLAGGLEHIVAGVAIRLRIRAAASLATRVVFSNSAIAPSTWRTKIAVGVSSTKCVGADAATRVTPLEAVPRPPPPQNESGGSIGNDGRALPSTHPPSLSH